MTTTLLHRSETMLDIYKLLPEGTPVQLIENNLLMSPAPPFSHFYVSKSLYDKLNAFIEKNKYILQKSIDSKLSSPLLKKNFTF